MHRWTDIALAALAALIVSGCASTGGASGAPRDPRSAVPPGIDASWIHFTEATVQVGDAAPDFTLPTPDGERTLSLSTFRGVPLVLVFGSHT